MDEVFLANVARLKTQNSALADFISKHMLMGDHLEIVSVSGAESTVKVNGIHLTSCQDRKGEAEIACRRIPMDAEIAHVYGVALCDHVEYLLAHRPKIKKIYLHILNLELFVRLLRTNEFVCLGDPRVCVSMSNKLTRVEFPFMTYVSELVLADHFCQKIKDHLYYQLGKKSAAELLSYEFGKALQCIEENRQFWISDKSVDELFGSLAGRNVAVVSRGWSLDDDIERLRDLIVRKNLFVICADLSSKTLFNNNIHFDIVACGSPNFTSDMVAQNPSKDAVLVYSPTLGHEVVPMFDSRYVAFTSVPILNEVKKVKSAASLFFEGSATHFACDLAVQMGAASVYMFGCDYSLVDGRMYTSQNAFGMGSTLLPRESQFVRVSGTSGSEVQSLSVFQDYVCSLEEYIQDHPDVQFYNMSWIGAEIKGTLRYA